jgi:hypothetical protein
MINMSDGKSDGFVIMYCQDGVIYPVALNRSEVEMLDITIGMSLKKVSLIKEKPQGEVVDLLDKTRR